MPRAKATPESWVRDTLEQSSIATIWTPSLLPPPYRAWRRRLQRELQEFDEHAQQRIHEAVERFRREAGMSVANAHLHLPVACPACLLSTVGVDCAGMSSFQTTVSLGFSPNFGTTPRSTVCVTC